MFGKFTPPFEIPSMGLNVSKNSENVWFYSRQTGDDSRERMIQGEPVFYVHPIEPLQLPKPLAKALLVDFDKPITLAPLSKSFLFLTFPLEIGVFLGNGTNPLIIDTFCLEKPKMTLYGKVNEGFLCRHHKSEVYFDQPKVEGVGVLQLEVKNDLTQWATLSRALFNAHGIKIFFHQDLAYMSASLKILERNQAEIECLTSSFLPEGEASFECFPIKRLSTHTRKILLEDI